MSWNGTVRCGHCYAKGHNQRTCPSLKKYIEENPNSWRATAYKRSKEASKARSCSYCDESGHNRRTCSTLKSDIRRTKQVNSFWCTKLADYMKEEGLGIGALVKMPGGWRHDYEQILGMVIGFAWSEANFRSENNSYSGGFVRCRAIKDVANPDADSYLLRLPEECWNLQDTEASGQARITELLSPVPLDNVEFPDEFIAGDVGILDMFDGKSRAGSPIHSVALSEMRTE